MLNNKSLWHREGVDVDETSSPQLLRRKFIATQTGEAITGVIELTLREKSLLDVSTVVAGFLNTHLTSDWETGFYALGSHKGIEAFAYIYSDDRRDTRWNEPAFLSGDYDEDDNKQEAKICTYKIAITGDRIVINAVSKYLIDNFGTLTVPQIKWWYKTTRGEATRTIYMDPLTTKLLPELYPWLGMDPAEFIKDYLNSDKSILLLAGVPGVGKTSLLRHMIVDNSLVADIIYDEELMKTDQIFQSFLFNKRSGVLVIEDADSILSPRDGGHNPLMARFLNVSDGLIKLPNKKLIFTTNQTDFDRVDQALIRPGRCFAVVHARELTFEEAVRAAKACSLTIPTVRKDYTLAELFSERDNPKVRKIGF